MKIRWLGHRSIAVIMVLFAAPLAYALSTGGEPLTLLSEKDIWVRMRGTKYSSIITVTHDSTAIIVNGDRFEVVAGERTPLQRILCGDYGEYEVYQYAAERIAGARNGHVSVPPESLQAITIDANCLLAKKEHPEIGIALDADGTDATILRNGVDAAVRVEINGHRPISRAEMVRRIYDAIVGGLSSGRCVVWGDKYFASFSVAQGLSVDGAISHWMNDKASTSVQLVNDDESVQILGEIIPRGVLYDIDSTPTVRQ